MALDSNYNEQKARRALQEQFGKVRNATIERCKYIGETFVRNARLNGEYRDITANLRSSVGAGVFNNGIEVDSYGFEGEAVGASKGRAYMLLIASRPEYQKGIVLIGVAGMEYAAKVESRGRDVITGSSIEAKNQLETAFKSFGK